MKKIVSITAAAALAAAVSFAAVQPSAAMPAPPTSSDNGAGVAVGVLGVILGAVLVNAIVHNQAHGVPAAAPAATGHQAACEKAYKSYVAASDSFTGRDGKRHRCTL